MNSSRSAGPRSRGGMGPAGRGSRSVSVLYGTFSAVLVVAALVMALIVRPPPPPSIAALGPSPQDQIEKARQNQAAGSGPGEVTTTPSAEEQAKKSSQQAGPSATSTTAPTTSPSIEVSATRRCFGDPPRQTEDPHSPPCVFEVFQGNNGGRTAPGVTGTEIHAYQDTGGQYGNGTEFKEMMEALVAHFNRRYEFYGRRIVIDYGQKGEFGEGLDYSDSASTHTNPSQSNAMANDIIADRPFASLVDAPAVFQGEFHRKLAEAGIQSIQSMDSRFFSSEILDGWTWLMKPPIDVVERLAGDWVCRAFSGRKASHAGEARLRDMRRKFAVIAATNKNAIYPDVGPIMQRLRSCGANAEKLKFSYNENQEISQFMLGLKSQDYTTLLPIINSRDPSPFPDAATKVNYFPEWFDFALYESIFWHREANWDKPTDAGQNRFAFGFTSNVRVRSEISTPAWWALNEGGGSVSYSQYLVEQFYYKLLVLASGIQMAGPRLTPNSFRRALWNTVWPNPNPGKLPYRQQRVSLGPGDPVFFDDYAMWWWNERAPQQTRPTVNQLGRGSFCYLKEGDRFLSGAFPVDADTRLFHEIPCR